MPIPTARIFIRQAPKTAGFTLAGLLPLLGGASAQAMELSFADGEIQGALDTTISYGQMWRVQGRDKTNDDININDGNRNFDTGLVSEVYKLTSDLELSYKNYGLFIRGSAFYDTQIMDKRTDYAGNNNPWQPSQIFRTTTDSATTPDTLQDAMLKSSMLTCMETGKSVTCPLACAWDDRFSIGGKVRSIAAV